LSCVAQDAQPQATARGAEDHLLHGVDGRRSHIFAFDICQNIIDTNLSGAFCSTAWHQTCSSVELHDTTIAAASARAFNVKTSLLLKWDKVQSHANLVTVAAHIERSK
jgi:hypothetical protein